MSCNHQRFSAVFLLATALFAQHRVDPYHSYHRVVGVLPLIGGSGSPNDPIRPKYAPNVPPTGPSSSGIIAFTFEFSDDGKHAIAELVAVDRTALAPVLADHSPGVIVFEKGLVAPTQIESAVRQYRKDFSLNKFGVPVQ